MTMLIRPTSPFRVVGHLPTTQTALSFSSNNKAVAKPSTSSSSSEDEPRLRSLVYNLIHRVSPRFIKKKVESYYLFRPPSKTRKTPEQVMGEKAIEDNVIVNGKPVKFWLAPPKTPLHFTIFLVGGRGNSLEHYPKVISTLRDRGFGVVRPTYPGFEGNKDVATIDGAIEAVSLVRQKVAKAYSIPPQNQIWLNYSIGNCAAANALANTTPSPEQAPNGLIMVAPIDSTEGVFRSIGVTGKVPSILLPGQNKMVNQASTLNALSQLPSIPSLVAVGDQDRITPLNMVESVAKTLKTRPPVHKIKNTGHIVSGRELINLLNHFLQN